MALEWIQECSHLLELGGAILILHKEPKFIEDVEIVECT